MTKSCSKADANNQFYGQESIVMKQWISGWMSDAVIISKVMLVIAVPTALLLFHVWNQYRITEAGYRIAEVTAEHRVLLEENKKLTVEASVQGRSDRVAELAQQQFGLGEAHPDQIITIAPEVERGAQEHALLDDVEASSHQPAIH